MVKRKKYINDIRKTCKSEYGNRHFWCRGYYVDTVGKNTAAIKAYIQNQLKENGLDESMEYKEENTWKSEENFWSDEATYEQETYMASDNEIMVEEDIEITMDN